MVFEVKGKLKKNGGAEPLGVKKTTNNKIDPHMTSLTGFELRRQKLEGECSHVCAIPAQQYESM